MEEFQVMGFIDVFKALPRLIRHFKTIRSHILNTKPEVVLFIDYPGFNLRMAKSLRKHGYKGKLVHYICPTVWAHGKKRIRHLADTLDLLLTIFPFESKLFSHLSLPINYVGHPLVEEANNYEKKPYWKRCLSLKDHEHVIGIFPGSRKTEIEGNLPKQLEACQLLKKKLPATYFAISVAHPKLLPLIQKKLKASSLKLNRDICLVNSENTLDLMQHCKTAIATSGTVTFQLALKHLPTAVVYHLSPFNWFMVKFFLRLNLPFYCIVNIILNKSVFPELMHKNFTSQALYQAVYELDQVKDKRLHALKGCQEVYDQMFISKSPGYTVAEAIEGILND